MYVPLIGKGGSFVDTEASEQSAFDREQLEISRRKALTTVAKLGLGSAAMVAALKAGHLEDAIAAGRSEDLPKKGYHFVFVNHVTTNAFFTPTQSGAADACKLLGCSYSWTGSENSIVSEMTHAMQTAIAGRADGIAVAIIDPVAFGAPIASAFAAGIPVISYNADGTAKNTPQTNMRLAYIGQSLYTSGFLMGQKIVKLVGSGHVVIFIATYGTANIQPRLDGAEAAIRQFGGGKITYEDHASGALEAAERRYVESFWLGHRNVKGMFAVDQGSTTGAILTSRKYGLRQKGLSIGGYDLTPEIVKGINDGVADFTIDQQPYLQGFYPIVQLFLYKLSAGLVGCEDMNTGIKFVTKSNIGPYLKPNVFQGSSTTNYQL
jgi:simple sugar transport system substrate-binding protein